jgi:thymidylate synthase (FAD)
MKTHETKLISISQSVDGMTAEESIAYMARVSSPNQRTEDAEKLLIYCLRHGHYSIFEMADMCVEIHTSRAIMAQVLRHKSFSFQEFSQRYSAVPEVDWSHVEMRRSGSSNRQSSLERCEGSTIAAEHFCAGMENNYLNLIEAGIAPETARMLLPLATPTRAYMKGSVRSWITYFWQRLPDTTQKEHRDLAEEVFVIFEQQFPVIAGLVKKYKPAIIEA